MKAILFFVPSMLIVCLLSTSSAETRLKCASTTSTQNSGLFEHILPLFEKEKGIKVDVIALGTGAAIELGKRGDVDVVLVHAREQELKAENEGFFVNRHDVMYNDFIVIGPTDDPTKIKGMGSAADAFAAIAKKGALFVSRGDNSGTHTKELSLWKGAELEVKDKPWYLDAGQGMEKTQRIANEKRGYTLTDRGTWLGTKEKDNLDMVVVFEGDPALFNQYGVMAVNPAKYKNVSYKAAMEFVDWLVSTSGQDAIASFKDKKGNQLFIPNAKQE